MVNSFDSNTKLLLNQYKIELQEELQAILDWWEKNMFSDSGKLFGEVNNLNTPAPNAPLGLVMTSRMLWTYSASASLLNKKELITIADGLYKTLIDLFYDREFGGFYWCVDENEKPENSKKQIYGIAFALYGIVEYYKISKREDVLALAINSFELIEKYAHDEINKGYFEAFNRKWEIELDQRLSKKDENEAKSMNTHLHILEAYTSLARVWNNNLLTERIKELLLVFETKIINNKSWRQHLFFDENWTVKSHGESYGHDIEASWLLLEAASLPELNDRKDRFEKIAVSLANASEVAIDSDGGMWYENEPKHGGLIKEKHWWPQAEAMVGYFNAWEITGDIKWLSISINSWGFIKKHIKDATGGEWFWGIDLNNKVLEKEKAGFWKCPYHNGRACIEIINRINNIK